MARARELVDIDCEGSFATAAALAVAARAEEAIARAAVVSAAPGVDAVHDARVAARRLRVALDLFAPCFPAKPRRRAAKRARLLGRALGKRRDADVALALLGDLAGCGDLAEAGGERLAAALEGDRATADAHLGEYLTRSRLRKLDRRLRRLAERAGEGGAGDVGLRDASRPLLAAALAELPARAPAALDPDAVAAQHELRIAAKRLRYALELLGPCWGEAAPVARRAARDLQSILGDLRDGDLLAERAEEPGAALATALGARRSRLHREFLGLWDRIEADGSLARLGSSLTA